MGRKGPYTIVGASNKCIQRCACVLHSYSWVDLESGI